MPVDGDDTRARCRYCRILLRAHNSDLRNHARTSRHATNVAFGRPCADPLLIQNMSRTKNMGSVALSGRKRLGYSKDWRCMQTTADALDSPDDSLASLSSLNTLISFGWNSPEAPETTLVLQNNLPLDEQLIASLPETPGLRFRVKKQMVAAGSESGGAQNKNVDEDRQDESTQQTESSKDLSSDMLSHVARSLTLWEFMMLKLGRGRANAEQTKVAEILTEFSELHSKVKAVSHNVLKPATDADESDTSKHVMLDSQELANCLSMKTGLYHIKSSELNKATTINCRSLIPPMRRRLRPKRTNIASRYIKTESIAADASDELHDVNKQYVDVAEDSVVPRYVIHPDLLDPSSSVIVQGLDGAMAGHLVLVSENGEMLLQCDAKDFTHLSHTDTQQITVEPSADEGNCEHGNTSYVIEDDNADLSCDLKILSSGIS